MSKTAKDAQPTKDERQQAFNWDAIGATILGDVHPEVKVRNRRKIRKPEAIQRATLLAHQS